MVSAIERFHCSLKIRGFHIHCRKLRNITETKVFSRTLGDMDNLSIGMKNIYLQYLNVSKSFATVCQSYYTNSINTFSIQVIVVKAIMYIFIKEHVKRRKTLK